MNKKLLKSTVCILLALCSAFLCVPLAAAAQSVTEGQCGPKLYWKYEKQDARLTISGSGPMYNYMSKGSKYTVAPWIAIPTDINSVVIEEGCTRIGNSAFAYCIGIEKIVFPEESLKEIGDSAFYRADKLTNVKLPGSVVSVGEQAFSNCGALTSVDFGGSVEKISKNMFYGDAWLRYVNLGAKCRYIMQNAFYTCTSLVEIDVSGIEEIYGNAFYGCEKLKSIHFGKNLKKIGSNSFAYCSALEDITFDTVPRDISSTFNYETPFHSKLPNGFYTICDGQVLLCKNSQKLTASSYTVPSGVKVIGGGCFNQTATLAAVTVPEGVEAISSEAFSNCAYLRTINLPSSIEYIGDNAFGYNPGTGKLTYLSRVSVNCSGCSKVLYDYCNEIGANLVSTHSFVREEVSSDCVGGKCEIVKCSVCGYEDDVVFTPGVGHKYVIINSGGTCVEPNVITALCSVCGDEMFVAEIPAAGHKVTDEWSSIVLPGCDDYGYIAKVCTVCGEAVEKILIDRSGHKISTDKKVISEPTCTESGLEGYYCEVCGEYFGTSIIAPAGHTFGEYKELTADDPEHGISAFYVRTCSVCGKVQGKWGTDLTDEEQRSALKNSLSALTLSFTRAATVDFGCIDYDSNDIISTGDSISVRRMASDNTGASEVNK